MGWMIIMALCKRCRERRGIMAKKTLQRFYMTGSNTDVGAGQDHVNYEKGIMPLDGWLVAVDTIMYFSTDATNGGVNVFSIGVVTNPWEPTGMFSPTGLYEQYYTDLLIDFLAAGSEAGVYHGSERLMPQYYVLTPDPNITAYQNIPIQLKKLFRRGIKSMDRYGLRMNTRTIRGVADIATVLAIHIESCIVVAPNNWSN